MPKPILHTIESGGSGTGQSYYKDWIKCPRYAHLKYEEGVETPDIEALVLGTIFHAYCYLHEARGKKSFNPAAVEFSQTSGGTPREDWRLKAETLFRNYRKECPAGTWGEFVSAEEVMHYSIEGHPVTIKPDLVTLIDKKRAAALSKRFDVTIKPGYWLIDYKTSAWKTVTEPYTEDIQGWLYQMGWNHFNPGKEVQGALMVIVTKTKQIKIIVGVVPKVKEYHRAVVTQFIRHATLVKNTAKDLSGVPYAVPINCYSYGRPCPYKGTHCDRV